MGLQLMFVEKIVKNIYVIIRKMLQKRKTNATYPGLWKFVPHYLCYRSLLT